MCTNAAGFVVHPYGSRVGDSVTFYVYTDTYRVGAKGTVTLGEFTLADPYGWEGSLCGYSCKFSRSSKKCRNTVV